MIISHRGFWIREEEKNSVEAFERSFSSGFGTETDIRDFNGELVISHDIPTKKGITLKRFFEVFNSYDNTLPLALNIKSDGLQSHIFDLLKEYDILNYFVFDMSVPDALGYLKKGIKAYTRESEYERTPSFYEKAKGVWMDEFKESWIEPENINKHLSNNKEVCIVSPELHKRDYLSEWKKYGESFNFVDNESLHICTDKPQKAKDFFK